MPKLSRKLEAALNSVSGLPELSSSDVDDDGADEAPTTINWQTVNHAIVKPRARESSEVADTDITQTTQRPFMAQIVIHPLSEAKKKHYHDCAEDAEHVLKVLVRNDVFGTSYTVLMGDGRQAELTQSELQDLQGGSEALERFEDPTDSQTDQQSDSISSEMSLSRPRARRTRSSGFVNSDDADIIDSDSSEEEFDTRPTKRRKQTFSADSSDDETQAAPSLGRLRLRQRDNRPKHRITLRSAHSNDLRQLPPGSASSSDEAGMRSERLSSRHGAATRKSARSTRHLGDMQDVTVNDDFMTLEPTSTSQPKVKATKEVFKPLPTSHAFRAIHMQACDSCGEDGRFAPLIYCQGCVFAYHKDCIGTRSARDHLVTKIAEEDFVLQCRRCVNFTKIKKEPTAPDAARCQECQQQSRSCKAWRARKSTAQEQKAHDDNDGVDPVTKVAANLINNADNVLFRCVQCYRGCHFSHLPPRKDDALAAQTDAQRFREYSDDWLCKECHEGDKVGSLVAWRPVDVNHYDPSKIGEEVAEDDKAYLVRWLNKSYLHAAWMSGPWVWGVTTTTTRKAFNKRDETRYPILRFEDAIPEDYLRVDIVLDVRYTSVVDAHIMEVDKARIKEVDEVLVKYKGLGYEDAVWDKPPSTYHEERWSDFVSAYNYWVQGNYIQLPRPQALKHRLEKARSLDFATKLERKTQPENLEGGELMKYQLEGLNWLLYKWYTKKNAVLADEMGLGKTIQIIGYLATLVQDWNCFPFLIVVPNSTCANWRREIKQWAPSLRVVSFFGSRTARDLAYQYELFPQGKKDMRCHVVVTSYDTASDENCRKFFRSVPWQGLIVDEGQRLKNDASLLYAALSGLDIPHKVLLTGTPLQNNARELFNLLQFLDPSYNAAQLDRDFEVLDADKISRLHDMIRPFFLRRTKAQVLTFLPPMAQIILPVSMSTVTKKLYRSIIAKNPDLLRAVFAEKPMKSSEKSSLNNILMQLRKCLCHPFVYSQSVEERDVSQAVGHRNLVEASGKLQLLEILLPKLKERGHRVLIFSQFLDMLNIVEDFLDGLGMRYQRLDGSINSLVRQKRIDEFNAPDSELFVFLLSTRAGGVGINLATADTVIILDPDFNPHQDIQALSRAHRIGQKKKVSCYQLVTRASAEEKIMQIGRKKMALDHVLIEQMDAEDAGEQDLESILRHGAGELFEDNGEKDLRYDDASVEMLLNRSDVESTKSAVDKSAESQFSLARVWANNDLENSLPSDSEEQAPNSNVWDQILKERERIAAAEAAAAPVTFGRGRRKKTDVVYSVHDMNDPAEDGPVNAPPSEAEANDTDFHSESDDESVDSNEDKLVATAAPEQPEDLSDKPRTATTKPQAKTKTTTKKSDKVPKFTRVALPTAVGHSTNNGLPTPPLTLDANYMINSAIPQSFASNYNPNLPSNTYADSQHSSQALTMCIACSTPHASGSCPLRSAGVEYCNLCGTAHLANFRAARICPHLSSETQVKMMLLALKQSPEPRELVQQAIKYLSGVRGGLRHSKKIEMDRVKALTDGNGQGDASGGGDGAGEDRLQFNANGGSVGFAQNG